jgi:steroid delta-isomerase
VEDLQRAVDEHTALFNASVLTGEWSLFVAMFDDDATMRFVNASVGPFVGRAQIAAAYAKQPPDDTMTIVSVEPIDADSATVRFIWTKGGNGTMTVRWRDGQVVDLTIAYD